MIVHLGCDHARARQSELIVGWVMRAALLKVWIFVLCFGCGVSAEGPSNEGDIAPRAHVELMSQSASTTVGDVAEFPGPFANAEIAGRDPSAPPLRFALNPQDVAASPPVFQHQGVSLRLSGREAVGGAFIWKPRTIAALSSAVSARETPAVSRRRAMPPRLASLSDTPPTRMTPPARIAAADLGGANAMRLVDMASGQALVDIESDLEFAPASVTKILTALYAMEFLPKDYRFTTSIVALGPVENGVLQGDLALLGGGDPTLDSDDLDHLARELRRAGITEVTGAFLVWSAALPYHDELAPEQRDYLAYNPAISGLNLNFNRVHFSWARQNGRYDLRLEARAAQSSPKATGIQITTVSRDIPIFDTLAPDQWTVSRAALSARGSRWLPVRRPAAYAGGVFRELCAQHGVSLPAPKLVAARPEGRDIVHHSSAPLEDIIRDMLYYSNNLTAEVLGIAASQARGLSPVTIEHSSADMSAWLLQSYGVDMHFEDHSGLDPKNRVTAGEMTALLAQEAVAARLRPVLKRIGIGDGGEYPGDTLAKTGTLNFVSNLAGYVEGADGRQMSFAILSADLPRRAAHLDQELPNGAIEWNARAKALQEDMLKWWRLRSGREEGAPE